MKTAIPPAALAHLAANEVGLTLIDCLVPAGCSTTVRAASFDASIKGGCDTAGVIGGGGGGDSLSIGAIDARLEGGGKHRRPGPSRTGAPLAPIRLRVSRDMADRIAQEAQAAGLTGGAWVRGVLADRLAMDDPADRQPVRAYGGGGPDAAALTALRMQLHETGGLLTQVAKVARRDGHAARHADAEATLAAIREAIAIIAEWQKERRAT